MTSASSLSSAPTPVVLITGGSRGLGRSAALAAAHSGIDVVLTYRHQAAEAQAVVADIEKLGRRAVALPLDVGDVASFEAFAARLQQTLRSHFQRERFDFLVNNAGMGVHAPITETTEAQFDALVNVHLKGVFFLTQRLLPLMNDGGRILNLSSGLARFALPGYAAYAAMKGALPGQRTGPAWHHRERGGPGRHRD
jgi:NAD(P)-dependent dehydrogenase (short-subunit alcohol dehydrogenase family)